VTGEPIRSVIDSECPSNGGAGRRALTLTRLPHSRTPRYPVVRCLVVDGVGDDAPRTLHVKIPDDLTRPALLPCVTYEDVQRRWDEAAGLSLDVVA